MKKFVLVVLAVFAVGCNSTGVTGPSPVEQAEPVAVQAVEAEAQVETPDLGLKIKNNGTVVNNSQVTYTACLYDAPFGEGTLVEQFRARPGVSKISYVTDTCFPKVGQLDLIAGECPTKPHGLQPFAANTSVNIPAGKSGGECEVCEDEEFTAVGEPRLIEEGDWSKCALSVVSASTVTNQCFRTRILTFEQMFTQCDIAENRTTTQEAREQCECPPPPCDEPAFWNQSYETNKNYIIGNTHVRGGDNVKWEMKIFAASRSSEYPNNPDYTKNVDTKYTNCKGQGELHVSYRWKGHGSKYWWLAIYKDGVRVWTSPRIDK